MSRGRVLEVSGPATVLLVGAAGSGKSTFASRWFPAPAIISSDAIRAAVTGDVENQAANARVFAIVHRTLERRLAAGLGSVVDATNLTAAGRRALLDRSAGAAVPAFAIVFALPGELVQRRNAERRDRQVPRHVVARHLAAVERLLAVGSLDREGYERVVVVRRPDDVDGLRLVLSGGAARWNV